MAAADSAPAATNGYKADTPATAPAATTVEVDMEPKWQLAHACGPVWVAAGTCRFRVWAPHGENVEVEIDGKEQPVPLQHEGGGFWAGQTEASPGQRYRICMGSWWNDCYQQEGARLVRRDPCARECAFNSAWCILHPPLQPPKPFTAPEFHEMVIYEVHVGSFVPAADEHRAFAVVTEKMEYIASLGFNCIQLMPTTEFGGLWGYNSRQLLAVHGKWGTAVDLHKLVERAHELGIAVLFDVVLNHGSSKLNVLWNYDGFGPDNCGGIYFEGEKDTPWGKRFAFHKQEVKDYLKQACRVWIEEYGVDGLRFDSVHNMPWKLLQEMTHELKSNYPNKLLIAEITPENPAVLNDAGFHSCWVHATHFDSLKIMKKFDGGDDGNKRLNMLKGMATLHGGRFKHIGGVHSALGSHDQIGDRHGGKQDGGIHRYYVSRLGGRGNWHARAQCRAWFGFQNCCVGLPMTFMGTETLQDGWWHVEGHHRFNWDLAGDEKLGAEMRKFVNASNKVRIGNPGLVGHEIRIQHEDPSNTILGFMRWSGAEACYCVLNLSESQWENREYGLNTGWGGDKTWKLALNSQAGEFGGWEGSATPEVTSTQDGKIFLNIPKWCCLVYKLA
eukprot:TRINITY_DN31530_c0_g1_i1.p1 TRINITY_DN31530_c0_g1~~TRINITY_DN31530_c0_g1_i1.p1  ORF type:complete len:635 (+),score=153.25 TRINITY_DN31530_c0_g1_i1:65-1906(+)